MPCVCQYVRFIHLLHCFNHSRDPNVEHTLKVYEGASKWLRDSVISERDINEAKFAVFSEVSVHNYIICLGI